MSTTTPHRPEAVAQYGPSKTPSRRTLGDLTSQVINTPPVQTVGFQTSEVTRVQSPLKQVTNYPPTDSADKENYTTPNTYSKSKKRGIEEVDAAETPTNPKMFTRDRDINRTSPGIRLTTDAMQRHTVASPQVAISSTGTNASQENNTICFVDPGSPTERATPSPEPEPLASQRSNQSFSDFLNYDQCSSQKSEHATAVEAVPTSAPVLAPAAVLVEEKKKSRADLLRTRLNFGLYKVKTNQVNKRDVDIISSYEATLSQASDAFNASRSTAMAASADLLSTPRVPNITVSSPRHNQGATFVQANLDPFRPIGKLGAAPVLFAPPREGTSISSHMLHKYDLSSSPPQVGLPQSISPNQLMSPEQTPQNNYTGRIRIDEGDSADLASGPVTAHQRLQRLKEQQYRESELSSNAVKGNAAAGLLELMSSQR